MATITISFHQITMSLLISSAIFGVVGLATNEWRSTSIWNLGRNSAVTAVQAFTVIGVAGICLALLMEILMTFSNTFKLSRAVQILTLLFVIFGFAALLIGVCVSGDKICGSCCGYSYWFEVIATVLMFEAVFFYVIAWRC